MGFRLLFPLRASAVHPSLLYCFLPCYWPLSVGAQVNWRVCPSLKKSAGKAGESRVPWPALAWATGDTPLLLCVGRLGPSTQQRCAPKSCVQGHPLPFSLLNLRLLSSPVLGSFLSLAYLPAACGVPPPSPGCASLGVAQPLAGGARSSCLALALACAACVTPPPVLVMVMANMLSPLEGPRPSHDQRHSSRLMIS